ncbi:MAG: PstS family phosphate ABC transporter substrate-binding protein [Actinomycetes bacterium]
MKLTRFSRLAAGLAAGALLLTACGGSNNTTDGENAANSSELSGTVKIDGSSTVAPLSTAAAEFFAEEGAPKVRVTVGTSGTGGGFEKFCAGETDISDASRPIKEEEAVICQEKNIEYVEIPVANDALTVVVSKDNDWVDCLTTEQLKKIWEPGSKVKSWKDVDSSFPDEKLELFGPGTDSGTFDYFTDVINGEEGASREDYSPSEDDNVIVQGVSGSTGGLGYFGYTYFEENSESLKALEIDSGNGCVAPSVKTAQDGTYTPLSRPLFIYPSKTAAEKPEVKAFLDFYLENDADIAEAAQFIPLNEEQKAEAQSAHDTLSG